MIKIVGFVCAFLAVGLLALLNFEPVNPAFAAQSTRDTLPTRTSTPRPTATPVPQPTLSPTPVPKVWIGRLVSNTLGYTTGEGSIFRVKVEGMVGTKIELRSGNVFITAESGTKPEYGPYTAEFAPVTAGDWNVSVPALGVSIQVVADNYNLAVIEFAQVPVPEATQIVLPTPTATPIGGQIWTGRLVSQVQWSGSPFARLLVQVVGRSNQAVRLSTLSQVINTADTGQKPDEIGPDTVEFAGLTPGKYIIEPLGLNARFDVELKPNTETRVEFQPQAPPPTPTVTPIPLPPTTTPTPAPPTATPIPTATLVPTETPLPTATATPIPTETPLPSPTPVTRWLGVIAGRTPTGDDASSIAVKVAGIEGLPIQLRASGSTGVERRCTTGQAGAEPDSCLFENLKPGQYFISPEGLGRSLPVMVMEHERVAVAFDLEVLPPGMTGWQARLSQNDNGIQASWQSEGIIRVRIAGRTGQVAALRSARGTERYCEVAANPLLGGLVCEFGQLTPGVYLVEALHTGAGLRLFVDGRSAAEVEFSPSATYATLALAQQPPVVGQGAQPRRTPTATTAATATQPAVVIRPSPTATVTPRPTSTPTPALAWQGRIVQTQEGVVGTIAVRAAGLKDHPVVIRSGPWQSQPQLTGDKPEWGEYATEFGALATGEYIIELVDLAEMTVNLGPGQFMLVEFRYDFVKQSR
ncbi:MAG: hypothetical protein L6R45_19235 [Anaerolineae bacterium]|nr:hypothetical protein [Anaerolineae bacterium]